MDELNVLNIPAFKRKRSISAHAKKQTSYMRIKPERKTRVRKSIEKVEERMIENPFRHSLPSEDLFPSPILDEEITEEPTISRSSVREMQICGRCEGYFDKIDVAVIQLTSSIRTGNSIIFETNDGLFEQEIISMQINRKDISIAHAGDDIGLKVAIRPKVGGSVYKVI
ncbi:MAG: hypothetical protein WC285_05070 [Candidatus Gracilibacteria bacterium]|jgi:hypothetical protein